MAHFDMFYVCLVGEGWGYIFSNMWSTVTNKIISTTPYKYIDTIKTSKLLNNIFDHFTYNELEIEFNI